MTLAVSASLNTSKVLPQKAQRIGFVDFDLDNFHANIYLKMFRGPLADRGGVVAGCHAWKVDTAAVWAEANHVPYRQRLSELNQDVDVFCILAPSHPELHLEMCEAVFPFGKPTFVDKTFAPNLAIAEQVFALADRYGVAVHTTSALRYTNVQQRAGELKSQQESLLGMSIWAGGSSWAEYGIHPVELAVSCLGPRIAHVFRSGTLQHSLVVLQFADATQALIHFNATDHVPFCAALTTARGTEFLKVDDQRLFEDAAAAMLDFFQAGRPLIDRAETLVIRKILDAVTDSAAQDTLIRL